MAQSQPPKVHIYESNRYSTYLTSALYDLYKQNTLCDVTICIGHKKFFTHKVVLGAVSPYFKGMFTSGFKESHHCSEVTIEGDADAFRTLLSFAYTGNLGLTQATVAGILGLACYMQIDKVVELCVKFIKDIYKEKSLSYGRAWALLQIADSHDDDLSATAEMLQEYLTSNFREFSQTNLFLASETAIFVLDCLQNPDILMSLRSEEQMLKIMFLWMRHDWNTRKTHAASLLKLVPLGLVPLDYLKEVYDGDDIPGCKPMLADAIQIIEENMGVNPLTLAKKYPTTYAWELETALIRTTSSDTVYYDTSKRQWVPFSIAAPTYQSPFEHTTRHGMVVVEDELYAAGGFVGDTLTNNFCKYNFRTNAWTPLDRMNQARQKCSLVELDGYIYAVGGDGELSVERYSISENRWSHRDEIPPLSTKVGDISAVAFEGLLFVYGGNYNGPYDSLQVYSPATDLWYDKSYKLTDPHAPLDEHESEEFPRVLTVNNGDCYLVAFLDVDHQYVHFMPVVYQLHVTTDEGVPSVSLGEPNPHENEYYDCTSCPFEIGRAIFVVANGFVASKKIIDTDLYPWSGLYDKKVQRKESVVQYTFDRLRLNKK